MSGTTSNQGYPYPLTTDFADVQDVYRLASAVDSDLRVAQAPFRQFMARPSFIARTTVNGSTFQSGSSTMQFGAVDWDNTGGAVTGNFAWYQPYAQGPSWWMFGAMILVNNAASSVAGDMTMAQLTISTTDQVTGVSSNSKYYQRNDDSATNGEWINVFAMAPVYRGSASVTLILNGSTSKGIQAGSRFWGLYVGPVV